MRRWSVVILLALAGCGEEKPPAAAEVPVPEKKAETPALPGGEDAEAATEILVKDPTYGERRRRDDYERDEKRPRARCGEFASSRPRRASRRRPRKPRSTSRSPARATASWSTTAT
jgi:hypothetical protein